MIKEIKERQTYQLGRLQYLTISIIGGIILSAIYSILNSFPWELFLILKIYLTVGRCADLKWTPIPPIIINIGIVATTGYHNLMILYFILIATDIIYSIIFIVKSGELWKKYSPKTN